MIYQILRIIFGFLFIVSAVLKLNPIEFFELVILDTTIPSKVFAVYFSRFIIGLEFALGWFFVFNFKPKLTLRFSFLLLVAFTVQTLYIWITQGQNSNCGCFGIYLDFGPAESFTKNIFLLVLNLLLIFKNKTQKKSSRILKIMKPLGFILLILPFILFPPSWYLSGDEETLETKSFPIPLNELPNENNQLNFEKGEYLLAFFSTSCIHCIRASYELSITQKNSTIPSVILFFVGKKEIIPIFFEKSNSNFPFEFFEDKSFVKITGGSFPILYHLKDGEVLHKYKGDGISIKNLTNNLSIKN